MRAGQGGFSLLDCRKIQVTALCAILSVGLAVAYPKNVVAQFFQEADGAARVGDRWVYDTRDEMTGYPKETYTEIVSELSPEETIVNLTFSGSAMSVVVTYDREWNCIDNLIWRFRPSSGEGISLPLAVGKTWRIEFDARNNLTGESVKGSSSAKVVAQEDVTTPAGTFNAFKIERQVRQFDTADPSKLTESQIVLWYAPQISHFVRRTTLVKFRERARSIMSEELADFTRGP
jgi:uncharacterized protein DUF3108